MKSAYVPGPLTVAASLAALVAFAGCGSSEDQKTTAENAEVKAQVENVCRQVGTELKGLTLPTTAKAAVQTQTESAQIFENATGKLNELAADTELPADFKSWIAQYKQLSVYNRQAAEAFGKDGITSDQALAAGQKWEAQAKKANALATEAGLDNCVVGKTQSG